MMSLICIVKHLLFGNDGRKAYAKKQKLIHAIFAENADTSIMFILIMGQAVNESCDSGTAE
jgi:hypothetical protein